MIRDILANDIIVILLTNDVTTSKKSTLSVTVGIIITSSVKLPLKVKGIV